VYKRSCGDAQHQGGKHTGGKQPGLALTLRRKQGGLGFDSSSIKLKSTPAGGRRQRRCSLGGGCSGGGSRTTKLVRRNEVLKKIDRGTKTEEKKVYDP